MAEKDATAEAREEHLAILFLIGADPQRFVRVMSELENAHTQGKMEYPTMLVQVYQTLLHQKEGNKQVFSRIGSRDCFHHCWWRGRR